MISFQSQEVNFQSASSWKDIFTAYNGNDPLSLFLFLTHQNGAQQSDALQVIEFVVRCSVLLETNRRVNAIKYIRERTGWNLRESKEFADTIDSY